MNSDLIFIWGFAILFGIYGLCRILQTAWNAYILMKLVRAYDPSERINNITPQSTPFSEMIGREHAAHREFPFNEQLKQKDIP